MDTVAQHASEMPFSTRSQRYYATPELTQRLHLIQHLLQNSEQLLLVVAEAGAGKTSLLQQLQGTAAEHWWMYTVNSTPALSPESCLAMLLHTFNVRQTGKTAQVMQEGLRSYIAAKRYNAELPILLVDDAHMLPLATLQLIIELAMQGEPQMRMRVVLFCEPQITSILAAPEFALVHNALIHTIDIPLLSKAQMREYIDFRLEDSPYATDHPFTNELVRRLHVASEGNPEQLNQLAHNYLVKYAENPNAATTLLNQTHGTPNRWLWGGLLLLLFIGSAILVRWKYAEMFVDDTPPDSETRMVLPLTQQPSLAELPTHGQDASYDEPMAIEEEPIDIAPPSVLPPDPDAPLVLAPTNVEPEISPTDDNNHGVVERVEVEPEPELASVGEGMINPELLLGVEGIKGEDWLLSQHPETYSLQVLGAHDPLTLKSFLQHHDLKDVSLFKTEYRQRDWYVLLQGVYPDRSQAMLGLQSLPQELRSATRPWPRTMASIQARIKRRLGLRE